MAAVAAPKICREREREKKEKGEKKEKRGERETRGEKGKKGREEQGCHAVNPKGFESEGSLIRKLDRVR